MDLVAIRIGLSFSTFRNIYSSNRGFEMVYRWQASFKLIQKNLIKNPI
jgi:hypothetical protein